MTHQSHRFAITTCKRPCPSGMSTFETSRAGAWGASSGLIVVRARPRRRRWDHG